MEKQTDPKAVSNILFLEDSPQDFELVRELLIDTGFDMAMDCVQNEQDFVSALRQQTYDVILSDFKLPGYDAFAALKTSREICPEVPFIVVSGTIGEETAIDLIKQGAVDYVLKDRPGRLPSAILRALGEVEQKKARKQAEEALRESEANFRKLADAARVMISIVADTEGSKYLYVNQEWLNVTGYTREEIHALTAIDIVHPDMREQVLNNAAKRVDGKDVPVNYELNIITKTGDKKILDFSPTVITFDGKKAFLTTAVDITQRKQAEETIRNERGQLLSIFDSIDETIYVADPDTYEILYVNQAMRRAFQKEMIGGICYREFQGLDAPCEFCTNDIILKQKFQPYTWEYHNPILDRDFAIIDRIITWPDGRDVRFELAIDITDRKRAEAEREKLQAQFIQAQKMESVGRLAGGVAHDFNNKLTVILGYAQMAMEGLDSDDPLYGNLQQVLKAGKQSVEIVRQLLAFARKQTIAPRVLDLNETIEGMLKMLRRLIGEDIDLAWEPAANLWQVNMDPTQIDQILANLCVNARDAISGVGKVTLETENRVLDESYCEDHPGSIPGEYVMLAVSDDGIGMDKETLANAFEPFFTTKEVGKGTGLGLSTVYGIVKQNQGFVNIYSEPGRGTCFKIYLPRHPGEGEEGIEAVETEIPRGRGETILVVEDETSVLHLARRILEKLGYAVLTSPTPAEAVAMAREHSGEIHLLMTDVVLPGMSGRDLAGEVKQIRPDIRTLFMSGYTANVIAHQGVLDEGVQFIGKPFTPDSLGRKVWEAFGSEK